MIPRTANAKGRIERSRAGTHTRLQLLCQTPQPFTAAFVGTRSARSTNDGAVSTAAPLSTESVLVPLRIFSPPPPPLSPPWYSTVTAAPRANIQTVAQPRGDAIGLADVEDCATSYTSRMLSNSVSGSGVTCLDAD